MVYLSVDEGHQLWSSLESGSSFCQGETSSGPRMSAPGSYPEHQVGVPLGNREGPGSGLGQEAEPRAASYVCRDWALDIWWPLPAFLVPSHHQEVTSQALLVLTVQFTTPAPASLPSVAGETRLPRALSVDKTLLSRALLTSVPLPIPQSSPHWPFLHHGCLPAGCYSLTAVPPSPHVL